MAGEPKARAAMEVTGASKDDIDDMFGWNQAERAKDANALRWKAGALQAGARDYSRII